MQDQVQVHLGMAGMYSILALSLGNLEQVRYEGLDPEVVALGQPGFPKLESGSDLAFRVRKRPVGWHVAASA